MPRSTKDKLELAFVHLPRCAYLGAYYLYNGPFEPSSAQAITEIVARLTRERAEREFEIFVSTKHGRRLANERSDLAAALDDRESLAKMPAGSVGRLYLDYMNGMGGAEDEMMAGADDFQSLLKVDEVCTELGWPDELIWFMRRLVLSHDLTHVITRYGTDVTGEFANIAYTAAHLRMPVLLPIVVGLFLMARPEHASRRQVLRFLRAAYRRGREQRDSLLHLDYESLLPRPLDEVIREIGLEEFQSAHPDGPIIDGLGFGILVKEGGYKAA